MVSAIFNTLKSRDSPTCSYIAEKPCLFPISVFAILLEHLDWCDGLNELHVSVVIKLVPVGHYIHMYSFQNIIIIIEIYTSFIGTGKAQNVFAQKWMYTILLSISVNI